MQSTNISRQIDINVLLKVPRALSLKLLQRLPAEVHPRKDIEKRLHFQNSVIPFLEGGIEMQSSSILLLHLCFAWTIGVHKSPISYEMLTNNDVYKVLKDIVEGQKVAKIIRSR